ncbi:MAG: T9SS type A sorting domain-containing protein [Chitinophagales bacterium]|jgi:hypothetical protein|nr:T9SS type A sorting domain-containing protein [Chitinophagales bacterium]
MKTFLKILLSVSTLFCVTTNFAQKKTLIINSDASWNTMNGTNVTKGVVCPSSQHSFLLQNLQNFMGSNISYKNMIWGIGHSTPTKVEKTIDFQALLNNSGIQNPKIDSIRYWLLADDQIIDFSINGQFVGASAFGWEQVNGRTGLVDLSKISLNRPNQLTLEATDNMGGEKYLAFKFEIYLSQLDSNINSETISASIHDFDLLNKFNVYPNPTSGLFIINYELNAQSTENILEIFNALGQKVYKTILKENSNEIQIDLSHLSNGTYYCELNEEIKCKIIKK